MSRGTFLTNDDDSDTDFEDGPAVTVDPFWISETEMPNELLITVIKVCNGVIAVPGIITGGNSIFDTEEISAHNYVCESYVKWGWQPLLYMGGSQLYGLHDITYNGGFEVRSGLEDYPCTDITWHGAVMACNWLTTYSEGAAGSGDFWTRGGCASGASAITSNVAATAAVALYEYDSDGFTNTAEIDKVKGNRLPG